jgi:hypothetical protein
MRRGGDHMPCPPNQYEIVYEWTIIQVLEEIIQVVKAKLGLAEQSR